jgi:hypothetical protein
MFEFNSRTILLIAAVVLVLYVVMNKRNTMNVKERYQSGKDDSTTISSEISLDDSEGKASKPIQKVVPRENSQPMKGSAVSESPVLNPNIQVNEMSTYPGPFEGCFPKQKELSPEDLLPRDMNTKWAQVNPSGQGMLMDRNFLEAGHHVGVNTVGQTLRNANYSLRSEIPNPQIKVSPWQQSTIDPDVGRKPLEIGSGW